MYERIERNWERLPKWAVLGAGVVAAVAVALHLSSVVLQPPDTFVSRHGMGDETSRFAFSFAQIHLALGAGLILAAGGLLARRLGGLLVATLGLLPICIAIWAWYRNPLAVQLERTGVPRDILAADQLAPFYGAGALSIVALVLCAILIVWMIVVWIRLLGRG